MRKKTGMYENEVRQEMSIHGIKLYIIASQIGEGEWVLSVENPFGIRSVWFEFFASAHAAIEAGIKAVESEGIESFMETEGFAYLFENYNV